uniref:3'(2'),5'-bisphosphate nucleotidase CysQ n=1 Tax=Candidatus Kentrum sp. SD TaxID=2126332 RepID=A0A450Y9T4_9GAMM|nr:MAG: 3'(2'),5'-bisphosphate nucleotidase [Candidatus Kentron sp. SD]VFK44326.1 MAG: 3'(2'),5'-bisphosphate nucleotidase [Candidatus Kentron sp. SD]
MNMEASKFRLESRLDAVCQIARAAGDAILAIYEKGFSVHEKSDASPLTEADMASHRIIVAELAALAPSLPILSEEGPQEISFEERSRWETYWLVDPLDGTRDFIKRNGEFTVNIALIHQGHPLLGVVRVPVGNRTYFAAKGLGAYRWEGDNQTANDAIPIRVRARAEGPLRILASRSRSTRLLDAYLANAGPRFGSHEVVRVGSSLKFCLIAEGAADLYPQFGPTSEWDTAAAHAIILEAGGAVTDMRCNPLIYNQKGSLLNPPFFAFGHRDHDWSAFLPKSLAPGIENERE